eukprot:COSAG02_NODE_4228_length_5609_cov_2.984395_1_plen_355_part_00
MTFGSYMAFHWARKIYSVVKAEMGPALGLSTTEIGALDTVFLATYALCMPVSGHFVDRRDHRKLLGWAMVGGGLGCAACGILDRGSSAPLPPGVSFVALAALYVFTGCCQSMGWPANVAIMGGWFGKATRGCVLGVWNAHTSIGNIAGTLSATLAMTSFGWGAAFFLDGIVMCLMGTIVLKLLLEQPINQQRSAQTDEERAPSVVPAEEGTNDKAEFSDVDRIRSREAGDMPTDDEATELLKPTTAKTMTKAADGVGKGITIRQALAIPGVVEFSLCFFFAKFVSYTFLFWLPFYLQALGFTAGMAGTLSTVFDIGGIVGGGFLLAGYQTGYRHVQPSRQASWLYRFLPSLGIE